MLRQLKLFIITLLFSITISANSQEVSFIIPFGDTCPAQFTPATYMDTVNFRGKLCQIIEDNFGLQDSIELANSGIIRGKAFQCDSSTNAHWYDFQGIACRYSSPLEYTNINVIVRPFPFSPALTSQAYMSAENNGGANVRTSPNQLAWETLTLVDMNGGKLMDGDSINLKTTTGYRFRALNGGGNNLDAENTNSDIWEDLRIVNYTNPGGVVRSTDFIAFQTMDDYYVNVSTDFNNDSVTASSTQINEIDPYGGTRWNHCPDGQMGCQVYSPELFQLEGLPDPAIDSSLEAGEVLQKNTQLFSPDGRFYLILQNDGNLVLYKRLTGAKLWANNQSNGNATGVAIHNGNVQVMGTNWVFPPWTSDPSIRLAVQSDGNLVIYDNGAVLWSSNTCCS